MSQVLVGRVLDEYAVAPTARRVEVLGSSGGFSGAEFWRVSVGDDQFCLRRWPREHPDRRRLEYIHSVLEHVTRCGLTSVPAPVRTRDGGSFVRLDGSFWELAPWLPGAADFSDDPNPRRLEAALVALARFHQHAATHSEHRPVIAESPGVQKRLAQLVTLVETDCDKIRLGKSRSDWRAMNDRADRLLDLFDQCWQGVQTRLSAAARERVAIQPCVRDIWHDHVLFTGDEVTGIVDFGAMRHETVAGDVARLLGSLVRDDPQGWHDGIAAYQAVRPLSVSETDLIRVFDQSNVLMSGMNWLKWIYVDGRRFEDGERILARLDETLARLQHLRTCR